MKRLGRLSGVREDGMVALNQRIIDLNRILDSVELELDRLSGRNGATPTFSSSLNVGGNQVKNVGRSRAPGDCVTRRELEELGILGNRSNAIRLTTDLIIEGDLSIEGASGGSASVVTGDILDGAITAVIEDNVATSVSGDVIEIEDVTGVNGSTPGTLAMGSEGGKAQFLRLNQGALVTQDPDVKVLLCMLIEEVRALRNELQN